MIRLGAVPKEVREVILKTGHGQSRSVAPNHAESDSHQQCGASSTRQQPPHQHPGYLQQWGSQNLAGTSSPAAQEWSSYQQRVSQAPDAPLGQQQHRNWI